MEEIMYIEINNWSPGNTYPIDILLTEAMADKNCYFQMMNGVRKIKFVYIMKWWICH